jgi:hypothetical protein
MRIDQRQVERRQIQIRVRNRHKHRLINRRIALVNLIRRLPRPPLIWSCNLKRRVRSINLRNPGQELRLAGRRRCHVAVVGTDGLAGVFPLQENLTTGEGQGLGLVARDGRRAVVACCGVVHARLGVGQVGDAGVGDAGADDFILGGVIGRDPDLVSTGKSDEIVRGYLLGLGVFKM